MLTLQAFVVSDGATKQYPSKDLQFSDLSRFNTRRRYRVRWVQCMVGALTAVQYYAHSPALFGLEQGAGGPEHEPMALPRDGTPLDLQWDLSAEWAANSGVLTVAASPLWLAPAGSLVSWVSVALQDVGPADGPPDPTLAGLTC